MAPMTMLEYCKEKLASDDLKEKEYTGGNLVCQNKSVVMLL